MMGGNKQTGRALWRQRGRRVVRGFNACASILLALAVTAMVVTLSERYFYRRWYVSWTGYYTLSAKTHSLLQSLDADIRVVAFLRRSNDLYDDITYLLKEYEYAASEVPSLTLNVEIVDPDRDMARARELSQEFDVEDSGVIVFECAGRSKYVTVKDVDEYETNYQELLTRGQVVRRRVGFRGEQAFSSAIHSIVESAQPRVYFLTGHGERDIDDFSENNGYSTLARMMRRDNIEVAKLSLTESHSVPEDCSALVIAGPTGRLSSPEVELVSEYLARNGRVCLLLDPMVATGLDDLLRTWGVNLYQDVVVDPRQTWTGRELCVLHYGAHDVTRALDNVATMFYMPRSVRPVEHWDGGGDLPADRPRVVPLASSSAQGWAETNLGQSPAQFDEDEDRRGPVPIAVAIERGPVSGIDVELKPTRLIVVGDSDFVSNGALSSSFGGNIDFFMCSLNWLLERESLLAISAKEPDTLRLDMNRARTRSAFAVVSLAPAVIVALLGVGVWVRRRR